MNHTVGTAGVLAYPVSCPVRSLHQFLVRFRVTIIEHVARPLPAEDVVSWVPPGEAGVILIAGQEIQIKGAVVEFPAPVFSEQEQVPE